MADGNIFTNTWDSKDKNDRAWFILRKTIERAEFAYDLHLSGNVDIDHGNRQYMIVFGNDLLKIGYFLSFWELENLRPLTILEGMGDRTINNFVLGLKKEKEKKQKEKNETRYCIGESSVRADCGCVFKVFIDLDASAKPDIKFDPTVEVTYCTGHDRGLVMYKNRAQYIDKKDYTIRSDWL